MRKKPSQIYEKKRRKPRRCCWLPCILPAADDLNFAKLSLVVPSPPSNKKKRKKIFLRVFSCEFVTFNVRIFSYYWRQGWWNKSFLLRFGRETRYLREARERLTVHFLCSCRGTLTWDLPAARTAALMWTAAPPSVLGGLSALKGRSH